MLLKRCRLKLSPDKIELSRESFELHGHHLTRDGVQADPEKIRAKAAMPMPTYVTAVQRLNGIVNYLSRFPPNLTNGMKPLRQFM